MKVKNLSDLRLFLQEIVNLMDKANRVFAYEDNELNTDIDFYSLLLDIYSRVEIIYINESKKE